MVTRSFDLQAIQQYVRSLLTYQNLFLTNPSLPPLYRARFYSPDPALFLSTTCICTSQVRLSPSPSISHLKPSLKPLRVIDQLPIHDDLTICSAVETFGGQWRRELTREVTHLICVSEHGEKYEMAIKFGTELGIAIVLPHW